MLSYGILNFTDQQVHDFLAWGVTLAVVGWALVALLRWLRRTRPALSLGAPVATALGVRIIAAFGVSATGLGASLRGGDEVGFFINSQYISHTPFLSAQWTDVLTGKFYEFVFASQILVIGSTQTILRVSQAGIAVAGIILLAVAVYELAGPRAARFAAWFLALEPANVFFSTLLHKEPFMLLAGGLVTFGGACMWKTSKIQYLWPIAIGCVLATVTRPYAGWFLIAAGAAITLHVGVRARSQTGQGLRSLTLVAIVVLLAAITAPTVLKASTHKSLSTLQQSQNANATGSANLKLEQVDFSTRGAIITNLPKRIFDVITKPYPWQMGNTSQTLGVFGTLFAWTLLFYFARELWRARGHIW